MCYRITITRTRYYRLHVKASTFAQIEIAQHTQSVAVFLSPQSPVILISRWEAVYVTCRYNPI